MNKLAIVGTHPDTRGLAPFDNKDFDIWVFNEAPMAEWCKRYDVSFQLHIPDVYTGHNTKNANYWEWLQENHGKPVYMQDKDERVPDSVKFPLDDVLKLGGVRLFGLSNAYALALALLQGYKYIEIYGVDLSASEYKYGANSWRFWVGFAKGMLGTDNVVLKSGQLMFQATLYGYEGIIDFGAAYFKERCSYNDNGWIAADKALNNALTAITKALKKNEFEKLPELIKNYEEQAEITGTYAGALAEAEKYLGQNTLADRGQFEYVTAKCQIDGEENKALKYHHSGIVEYIWNVLRQTHSEQAKKPFIDALTEYGNAAYETGVMYGMMKENMLYMDKYDGIAK